MAFGLAWWSISVVQPWRIASTRQMSALVRMSSHSSARSSFHQSRSRISTKLVAGAPGMAMPRANAP